MSAHPPADSSSSNYNLKPGFYVPPRTSAIGMLLFLATLFMLFASGMLGYVLVRVWTAGKLPLGSLHVPRTLWISTLVVMGASYTVQHALAAVRQEHRDRFMRWLNATLALAIVFVLVQLPSMAMLLRANTAMRQHGVALYALVFVLVLLHAMHVVGGVIALLLTMRQAHRGAYDHEHYQPVRNTALYWHFLDGVWIVMFGTFLLLR